MTNKEIEIQVALGTLDVNKLNGTEFLYYLRYIRYKSASIKWPWGEITFPKRDTKDVNND